jgi:hypothetical protein
MAGEIRRLLEYIPGLEIYLDNLRRAGLLERR